MSNGMGYILLLVVHGVCLRLDIQWHGGAGWHWWFMGYEDWCPMAWGCRLTLVVHGVCLRVDVQWHGGAGCRGWLTLVVHGYARGLMSVVKFTHSILGLYPGVASSLVFRVFLGTLPGDSSWKTQEGSTEHFPRWLVFSDGRWTVTGQYLRPA